MFNLKTPKSSPLLLHGIYLIISVVHIYIYLSLWSQIYYFQFMIMLFMVTFVFFPAGMPGEQIIHYVNQIMTTIILVLVLGAIITGLVCMYRKGIPQLLKQLCKQKYAPVKTCDKMDRKPQNVDVERGYGQPQNPPSYCTEENDACLFKSASAPLFNGKKINTCMHTHTHTHTHTFWTQFYCFNYSLTCTKTKTTFNFPNISSPFCIK